jgi:glyoxylase-like metal-dependent hydrolase (beta-lactamase superfamily II)
MKRNDARGTRVSRRELIAGALAAAVAARRSPAKARADAPAATTVPAAGRRRPGPAKAEPSFRLIPLNVGECTIGKNHVLGDPYSDDERVAFTLYAFLADGGPGRRVLIDMGPIGLAYINAMFHRFRFFRDLPGDPDAIRQPHGNLFDWLKRLRLEPADIDHIVLTHMHADHHGLNGAKDGGAAMRFPRARLHVSRIGWQDNLNKRVDGRWHSYVDYAFSDYLLKGQRSGSVLFHDNDEVLPGMDLIHLGGHSVCSQVIRLRTDDAQVIIAGDEIYHYSLFAKGILARLHTTPQELLAASNRLADLAAGGEGATLVPCHDPALWEVYQKAGDAWLRRLARISGPAARGFKASPKKALERIDQQG